MGRRLDAEGLWFVKNFVFPPKHAHLLPLRKSMNIRAEKDDCDGDGQTGQSGMKATRRPTLSWPAQGGRLVIPTPTHTPVRRSRSARRRCLA